MTERKKKILDQREHEEKKYKFIKEQIKPQKRKRLMRTFRKFIVTIVLATVFGSVSSVVFCTIMQNMMDSEDKDINVSGSSTLNEDDISDGLDDAESAKDGSYLNKSDTQSIYEYSRLSRSIASIGEACKYSLVTVRGYKKGDILNSVIGVSDSSDSYGVIIKEDKFFYYIVTKSVAVVSTKSIEVEFYNQDTARAELLAYDKNISLAVIKVEKKVLDSTTLSSVTTANYASINSNLAVGSKIIAVGAPNGVMYSVMLGTITQSQIRASVTDNEIKLLSTDIPRSPKTNGVILNTRGYIVGFITDSFRSVMGDTVVGFVELSSVQDVIRMMLEGKNVPYLGIEGKDVDNETAKSHNIDEGVYVTSVYSNSPAYKAGMRVADVITKIDGKKIISINQLHNALMGLKKDSSMKITLERKTNGKTTNKKITAVLD